MHLRAVLTSVVLVVAVACTFLNVGYYVWPLGRLSSAFRQNESPAGRPPRGVSAEPVSIVIAARNEAANLRRHLPSVLAQAYTAKHEIVVTDDASTDESPEVLAKAAAENPMLRVVTVTEKRHPGKKGALARGIAEANYDWLLATDADCRPATPHWVTAMMAARTSTTEIVLGYGPQTAAPGLLNRWIRYETVYTAAQYLSAALAGHPYMGVGRNLLYHRATYDRVGGFGSHEHLAGGDDDLLVNAAATAANTRVCLAPESWVYSAPKRTWRAYLRQKRRHLSVSVAYGRKSQAYLGLLAASHVGHYVGLVALLWCGLWPWALALYALRMTLVCWRMAAVHRGLGEADLTVWQPVLDAGVAVYYLVFGALGTVRRSEW